MCRRVMLSFVAVLVGVGIAMFAISNYARSEENTTPIACASGVTISELREQGKAFDAIETVMRGQEAKAFASVVNSEVGRFELEPTTHAIHFFEVPGMGVTFVVEVDKDGCFLANGQAPTDLIKVLISKMSAYIDRGKA